MPVKHRLPRPLRPLGRLEARTHFFGASGFFPSGPGLGDPTGRAGDDLLGRWAQGRLRRGPRAPGPWSSETISGSLSAPSPEPRRREVLKPMCDFRNTRGNRTRVDVNHFHLRQVCISAKCAPSLTSGQLVLWPEAKSLFLPSLRAH